LRFDREFDFETSNAQFDKVQIEKELKEKLTIGISRFQKMNLFYSCNLLSCLVSLRKQ